MKETAKNKNNVLVIHDFMIHEMDLKGNELNLYALIYSFTNLFGECVCSREYMAKRLSLSSATIDRTLRSLRTKGYISKLGTKKEANGAAVYKANRFDCDNQNDAITSDCGRQSNASEIMTKMIEKVYEKDIKNTSSSNIRREAQRRENVCDFSESDEDFLDIGELGIVRMTAKQYDSLIYSYGEELIDEYVRRLEDVLISRAGFRSFSHYATIKLWIRKDMAS